jgi:hypothetical protein
MNFRRPLSQEEGSQWEELVSSPEGIQLNEGGNKAVWKLEKS